MLTKFVTGLTATQTSFPFHACKGNTAPAWQLHLGPYNYVCPCLHAAVFMISIVVICLRAHHDQYIFSACMHIHSSFDL